MKPDARNEVLLERLGAARARWRTRVGLVSIGEISAFDAGFEAAAALATDAVLALFSTSPVCPSCRHEPMERQHVCEHCGHREAIPDGTSHRVRTPR